MMLSSSIQTIRGLLTLGCLCAWAAGQNGDKPGEAQPEIDRAFEVPDAPVLSAVDARESFALPAGYSIHISAADPLLHDPVDIAFDADYRMWVVEMQGLMRDADGTGELDPVGSIAVLTDSDDDGEYDTREVFADGLVLPRGICFGFGGVIAVLPPQLVWMRDRDGDGRADERVVIDEGGAFEAGLGNPEHAPNAPRLGLDNWLYLINHDWRYRLIDGKWQRSRVHRRGQWGMGQDDWGRQVFNYNSTPLYGDRVAPHYVMRNPAMGRAAGTNARLVEDGKVFSRRINVGVNRAYRPETLRADGHLATYTAACGPVVYRGTALAREDSGATFVCEPAGNLVRRNSMVEVNGRVSGAAVRGEYDFLTSTDERFRPVNLMNGPRGALYVVDLYRGILQHRVFLTSFLRRQIEERGLDKGIGLGRIWRIEHREGDRERLIAPGKESLAGLLAALNSDRGWRRATAQRLIVEFGPEAIQKAWGDPVEWIACPPDSDLERAQAWHKRFDSAFDVLEHLAIRGTRMERLHAMWTLEGLGLLSDALIAKGLEERQDYRLLAQWIRLSEARSANEHIGAWNQLCHSRGADWEKSPVFWQLAHSLGERPKRNSEVYDGLALYADPLALAPSLLLGREGDPIVRQGLLSGLAKRELDLHDWLDPNAVAWDPESPKYDFTRTSHAIGRIVARRGDRLEYERLFEVAARQAIPNEPGGVARPGEWGPQIAPITELREAGVRLARPGSLALLRGFVKGLEQKAPTPFEGKTPPAWDRLLQSPDPEIAECVMQIAEKLSFNADARADEKQRRAAHAEAMRRGKRVYAMSCIACHQTDGRGLPGLAPPLGDPAWLGKSDAELSRIVVHGLAEEIVVEGKSWNLPMPGWPHLSDVQVADVLTYVVGAFGTGKTDLRTIAPATVNSIR